MKLTKLVVLLLVTISLVALPLIGNAQPLDPKQLLRQQQLTRPQTIRAHDASLASCTALTNQVNLINRTYAACNNPNTAPQGSPVFNFNQMSNMQLGQFCGAKTMGQCVTDVLNAQHTYCDNSVKPLQAQADRLRAECNLARKECVDARTNKQKAEQALAALDNQKRQLEAQLTTVVRNLAAAHTALVKANVEVQHQCGIQVVHPPVPPPIHILLPPGFPPPLPPLPIGIPRPPLPPGFPIPPLPGR